MPGTYLYIAHRYSDTDLSGLRLKLVVDGSYLIDIPKPVNLRIKTSGKWWVRTDTNGDLSISFSPPLPVSDYSTNSEFQNSDIVGLPIYKSIFGTIQFCFGEVNEWDNVVGCYQKATTLE